MNFCGHFMIMKTASKMLKNLDKEIEKSYHWIHVKGDVKGAKVIT
jgi:hypothetical protein